MCQQLRTLYIPWYTYCLLGTIKILDRTSSKNNEGYKTLYCQHEKNCIADSFKQQQMTEFLEDSGGSSGDRRKK